MMSSVWLCSDYWVLGAEILCAHYRVLHDVCCTLHAGCCLPDVVLITGCCKANSDAGPHEAVRSDRQWHTHAIGLQSMRRAIGAVDDVPVLQFGTRVLLRPLLLWPIDCCCVWLRCICCVHESMPSASTAPSYSSRWW